MSSPAARRRQRHAGLLSANPRTEPGDRARRGDSPRDRPGRFPFPGRDPAGTGPNVVFDPRQYSERAALTLVNGVIYTGWTSHCRRGALHRLGHRVPGRESQRGLRPEHRPQRHARRREWRRDLGPTLLEQRGRVRGRRGRATSSTSRAMARSTPRPATTATAILKLSTASGLAVADYFAPYNQQSLSDQDLDLASSGILLLPDIQDASGQALQLAVGSGKQGTIYVVNRERPRASSTPPPTGFTRRSPVAPGRFGLRLARLFQRYGLLRGGRGQPPCFPDHQAGSWRRSASSQSTESFVYPGPRRRSPPMAPWAGSSGPPRTGRPPPSTPTTRATSATSFTTATRPRTPRPVRGG